MENKHKQQQITFCCGLITSQIDHGPMETNGNWIKKTVSYPSATLINLFIKSGQLVQRWFAVGC